MFSIRLSMIGLCLLVFSSCSGQPSDQPDIGRVSGVVTLDGSPVSKAQVTFKPEEGRPSSAVTDDEGRYDLLYNSKEMGAKVGKHRVSISTAAISDEEVPEEKMPEGVADGSSLTADVEGGSNEIDFNLESKDF